MGVILGIMLMSDDRRPRPLFGASSLSPSEICLRFDDVLQQSLPTFSIYIGTTQNINNNTLQSDFV